MEGSDRLSLECSGIIFTGNTSGPANHLVCRGFRGWRDEEGEKEKDKGEEGDKKKTSLLGRGSGFKATFRLFRLKPDVSFVV